MLVLSVFPGIGLLDMAFELEGFCVVRGPDLLWGGDIKSFHPPVGKFDGVIGGPPCQAFSRLTALVRHNGFRVADNLIPQFERVVAEIHPRWFLMENVVEAPIPDVPGYVVDPTILNNRWLGEPQSRKHRFSFGTQDGRKLHYQLAALESPEWAGRVCASGGVKPGQPRDRSTRAKFLGWKTATALKESLRLQGLPEDFLDAAPFTMAGKHRVIGNGVPLPMGRALAQAVKRALESEP